jgi:hypothetical protein
MSSTAQTGIEGAPRVGLSARSSDGAAPQRLEGSCMNTNYVTRDNFGMYAEKNDAPARPRSTC